MKVRRHIGLALLCGELVGAALFSVPGHAAPAELYFPESDEHWARVDPGDAGWIAEAVEDALRFAGDQRSSGLVILYRGRIVAERDWRVPIRPEEEGDKRYADRRAGFDSAGRVIEDVASVQKCVVAILAAIASAKGLLDYDARVSELLGSGWSNAEPEQESQISVRQLMSMTSGLDGQLRFKSRPDRIWQYNTRGYAQVRRILELRSGKPIGEMTEAWLTSKIGMRDSRWWTRPYTTSANALGFTSTARDLARLGLLILAQGTWSGQEIVKPAYLNELFASRQSVNPSHGLLMWWRNSESSCQLPSTKRREGRCVSAAPPDMITARGGGGRRVYIVPSLDLVVARIGDRPPIEVSLRGTGFDEGLWQRLSAAAPR